MNPAILHRMRILPSPARSFSLLSLTALAACGYSPLYAPGAGAANAAHKVQVGEVVMSNPGRNVGQRRPAQAIAQELKLNFPEQGAEMDTVFIRVDEVVDTLAVERTAAVQRAQVYLTANITLTDPTEKALLKTSVATSAPYNVEDTPYSTETAKTYARLTAARNLADEISRRIYLYYSTHKNTGGTQPAANSQKAGAANANAAKARPVAPRPAPSTPQMNTVTPAL